MAIATGTFLTFSAVGNREDLTDKIYNISPVDTPFSGRIPKTKATAVLHEWQSDSLAAATANAVIEGDDTNASYTWTSVTATTRLTNRCQISRKDAIVSGTQDAVNKAGRDREIVYQLVKRSKELKRDVETVLTGNQAVVTGGATTARQLRSLCGWYTTNGARGASGVAGTTTTAATDGTVRALTEALVKSEIQKTFSQGGEVDLIMCGPFNKTVISGFTGNNTRMQDTSDKRLATAIDVYESDFGTHRVVANRFSRERDVHLLTTDLWALATLRPMFTKDLATQGDNEKAIILVEYTLESRNEAGSSIVADCTTT